MPIYKALIVFIDGKGIPNNYYFIKKILTSKKSNYPPLVPPQTLGAMVTPLVLMGLGG